jgi:hypothetical protein
MTVVEAVTPFASVAVTLHVEVTKSSRPIPVWVKVVVAAAGELAVGLVNPSVLTSVQA